MSSLRILLGGLAAAMLLSACNDGSVDLPDGVARDYDRTVTVNGRDYRYRLHVPTNTVAVPAPMIISLHGGGSGGAVHDVLTQLPKKAEQAGFVLLTPEGREDDLYSWNAGACCDPAAASNVDHVAVISAMIDDAGSLAPISAKRIYAAGYSNGGMMAYRLACQLSGRIAAIAVAAGEMMDKDLTLGGERTVFDCAPSRPVPVLHLHGLADQCARFEGGVGEGAQPRPPRSAVPDNIAFWRGHNHCAATPTTSYENGAARCQTYSGCDKDGGGRSSDVTLCTVSGGGHTWPGAVYADEIRQVCGGLGTSDLIANDQVWNFFQRYSLP